MVCVSEGLQPADALVPAQVVRELAELRAENARLLRLLTSRIPEIPRISCR